MLSRRRGAAGRWALVLALVAVLVALPAVIGALPAEDADVSAAELRAAALASADLGFSGYAESAGGLALPVSEELPALADLFSDRTTMRVWWRGPADHRVDVVRATGETGVHRDAEGAWTWDYEANRATRSGVTPLALPQAPDLLPPTLGRRVLSEATDEELARTGAARIAGRDALGLRLVPAEEAASVARIDLWVDAATGLPLQVQLYAEGAADPALDTRFLDLALRTPAPGVVAFSPPEGVWFGRDPEEGVLDLADQRLRAVALPGTLAGLPRRALAGAPEAVGLYGRGVTLLAVVPVPVRLAFDLRRVGATSPTAVQDELGIRLAAGPVGIMLVGSPGQQSYVLTGTVTVDALEAAARELPELRSRG
ncbi:LolA family protein [Geodermatophilus sp. SYSU D00815]